jgi:hypothetical protein
VTHLRFILIILASTLSLAATGWWLGELGLVHIGDTLSRASVDLITNDPGERTLQRTGVAVALGGAAPLARLVRAGISRVSHTPPTIAQWATTLLFIVLGALAGMGGSLFNVARVAVPAALDASAATGAVQVSLAELALGNWAIAGAAGAAIILLAVGVASAGLERSTPPPA